MYYIGEFSKMGKTTVKTLHHYDRVGLLRPAAVDEVTGYRLYASHQLVKLHRIQALRQAGLSVDEVAAVSDGAELLPILQRRQTSLVRELEERESKLKCISFIMSNEKKELLMNYQVTIKQIPSCIAYTKRLTVPNYESYFEVIPAIGRAIKEANPTLKCATPEYCFISYLDQEYKENDISIEYNEAVLEFGNEVDGIFFREIPAVQVAAVMHKGAYANLPQAYAFAMEWVEKNGYRVVESCRENYIDGIWNQVEESSWLTEIQFPIEKA